MLAVAFGGTLHQDIGSLAGNEQHASQIRKYEETLSKPDTPLILEADSRLAAIIGTDDIMGPCHHHEAIKDLPAGFRVAARSAAGIIEAIESTDAEWFCFGIQSHPETRGGGSFGELFKEFAKACIL